MKINIDNIELFIIAVILVMGEGFFYILNDSYTVLMKNFSYMLSLLIMYIYTLKYKKIINRLSFKYEFFAFLLLIFISPINTNIMHDQPVYIGYKLIMCYFIYFNYFFISYYINKNELNKIKFEKVFILISILGSCLYLLQYFLYPNIILNGLGYRLNLRFLQPRLYIPTLLFAISLFYCLTKILFVIKSKNKMDKTYIFCALLNTFVLTIVIKTRTILIALVITIILLLLNKIKKLSIGKTIIFLVFIIPIFIGFINSDFTKEMISLSRQDNSSLSIRKQESEFFYEQFKSNIIIGRGEIHKTVLPEIDGNIYKMYLDDLGFQGIIVKFGVVGAVIWILILLKILIIIIKSPHKNQEYYFVLMSLIYILISGIFITYIDFAEAMIYIVILLVYADRLNNKRKRIM